MPKIDLVFNQKNFEYDIYHLIRAFYPTTPVKILYADPHDQGGPVFYVEEEADVFRFRIVSPLGDASAQCAASGSRRERKNLLKKLVYTVLTDYTGKTLPWGSLTGVRPVRIPLDLLEEGKKNTEAAQILREVYSVSPTKTALAVAIANRERMLLSDPGLKDGYCLYVGIPFCPSICLYCSFGSHPLERFADQVGPYLEALRREIAFIAVAMKDRRLNAVYIGGGTPTSLSARELSGLLRFIGEHFSFEHLKEFTLEAGRPDTIDEEKLSACLENKVTRISVNPQTMNQETLDLIGRAHTVRQTEEAFLLARRLGFDNINMDLIAGLPGEGPQEMKRTLERIKSLAPDSLTIHSLALKRSSRLKEQLSEYEDSAFANSEEIMELVGKTAAELSMQPYYLYRQKNIAGNLESVGYAREGRFGLYNILIMEEKQNIMAAGSGAISKLLYPQGRIERVPDVKDLKNYMERIDEMIERKKEALALWRRAEAERERP